MQKNAQCITVSIVLLLLHLKLLAAIINLLVTIFIAIYIVSLKATPKIATNCVTKRKNKGKTMTELSAVQKQIIRVVRKINKNFMLLSTQIECYQNAVALQLNFDAIGTYSPDWLLQLDKKESICSLDLA